MCAVAAADPDLTKSASTTPTDHPHAIYLDVLGRAGLYGVGYDFRFKKRFAIGAAVSYYHADGDHLTTVAPYVAVYPLLLGRHSLFVQAGATGIHRFTPSPVPEWMGYSQMNYSAEAAVGWEFRGPVLVRVYGMMSQGDHLIPWFGASFGYSL
ncbi:MAG TPA: hypothetical protein VGM88_14050 [Kofleriaceae bacterium]